MALASSELSGGLTQILITTNKVHNAVVHLDGHIELAEDQRILELQNTLEERRILYTTNWVIKQRASYQYIETFFVQDGLSDFVEKRFDFCPLDEARVSLRIETLADQQGFVSQFSGKLSQFVNTINDVILITKAEPLHHEGPRVLYVNDAFQRMTGYGRDEIIGLTPRILQGPDTKESAKQTMRDAFANWQQATTQLDNYCKNGRQFVVELHITPLKDEIGWWTHWISLQRDVTQRLADEQKLLKQEALLLRKSRLANIGEISSSVFHEVYNPLTILIGHLHMLNDTADERSISHEELKAQLEKMLLAGQRMEDILGGIRKLSRNSTKTQFERLNVMAELSQVASLVKPLYKKAGIKFSYPNDDTPPMTIEGQPGQFQQIILNLLTNARDATSRAQEPEIAIRLSCSQHACEVVIANTGEPVPEKLREKIFQPFFTTKSDEEGTGLGLSIVREFVSAMHGKIHYHATETGSEFVLSLPLAEKC